MLAVAANLWRFHRLVNTWLLTWLQSLLWLLLTPRLHSLWLRKSRSWSLTVRTRIRPYSRAHWAAGDGRYVHVNVPHSSCDCCCCCHCHFLAVTRLATLTWLSVDLPIRLSVRLSVSPRDSAACRYSLAMKHFSFGQLPKII